MNNKVINIYKKCGETPLDCINKLKSEDSNLRFLPMTYAGRLDPLAEGVLLILVGEECHKKDEYLSLSKEYEVDILFGFATDTYDVMGKIVPPETPSGKEAKSEVLLKMVWPSSPKNSAREWEGALNNTSDEATIQIQKIIGEFIGKIKQSYPPYSSRTVKGKPLFEWSREGKINEVEIPSHDVFVENIEILDKNEISEKDLLKDIRKKISKVEGDFRQKEILSLWSDELKNKEEEKKYPLIKLKISCGSGVYVRGIANDIGEKLGIPAVALKIVRTKVGEYGIN